MKLDFQVGAGNNESELPEVGLQVSRLFSRPASFFFPPLPAPLSLPLHLAGDTAFVPAANNPFPRLLRLMCAWVVNFGNTSCFSVHFNIYFGFVFVFFFNGRALNRLEFFHCVKDGRWGASPPLIGRRGSARRADWLRGQGSR